VGRLTGQRIPVRCALELVDGEPPVVGDGDGVVDAMQKRTVSSETWLAMLNCFRNKAGDRLETTAASSVVEELDAMRFWT
jgi:hypothetical protein